MNDDAWVALKLYHHEFFMQPLIWALSISSIKAVNAKLSIDGCGQVVVDFNGTEGKGEGVKSETESTSLKVLPPWMIRSGMVLTKEQRGEMKQETKMDGTSTSTATQYTDDKKSTIEQDDNKNIQARKII